jgi:hypothetical protein
MPPIGARTVVYDRLSWASASLACAPSIAAVDWSSVETASSYSRWLMALLCTRLFNLSDSRCACCWRARSCATAAFACATAISYGARSIRKSTAPARTVAPSS